MAEREGGVHHCHRDHTGKKREEKEKYIIYHFEREGKGGKVARFRLLHRGEKSENRSTGGKRHYGFRTKRREEGGALFALRKKKKRNLSLGCN